MKVISILTFALSLFTAGLASANECPEVLRLVFGEGKPNRDLYPSSYVSHFANAVKDSRELSGRGVVIIRTKQTRRSGTTACQYRTSPESRYVVILKLRGERGEIEITKQYPDVSDNDLSIFVNKVGIQGQFYTKGRWKFYVKRPVFNYYYVYYYSCGFADCTFRGNDTFPMMMYKNLRIQVVK